MGGPIAQLRNGDRVVIDAVAGTIDVALSEEKLAVRPAGWQPRQTDYRSGALWKFAQLVGKRGLALSRTPATLRNAIATRRSDQFDSYGSQIRISNK